MIIGPENKSHRRDYRLVNFYEDDGTVSSMWVRRRHASDEAKRVEVQSVGANFQ